MALYDDQHVSLHQDKLIIKDYYFSGLSKRVAYDSIERVEVREMGWLSGRGRLFGMGLSPHWYHVDMERFDKSRCIDLHLNDQWIRPAITPENPRAVLDILRNRLGEDRVRGQFG